MNTLKMLLSVVLVSGLALVGCEQSQAATLPIDVSLGYTNNNAVEVEGVKASVGTELSNVRLGITTVTSSERLEAYGAYASTPIYIQGTRLAVVPMVEVSQYRVADETIGGVGLGLEYKLTDSLRVGASGMVNRSFNSSDYSGEEYSAGFTYTF